MICGKKTLFTLSLFLCISQSNAAEFDWEQDLKYRLEADQTIRFWVAAKDGPIEQVSFQIHRIEDAKGFSLYKPGDTPVQKVASLNERGHRFDFKPDLKALAMETSYTVHFKLFGQTRKQEDDTETIDKINATGTFQIHRQSHSLAVEGLPEAPVRLYRLLPIFSVAHSMTLLLRGTSDPIPPTITDSQAVYLLDDAGKKVRLIEQTQASLSLGDKQKRAPLSVSIGSLKEVGRYQASHHLVRDNEKEPTKFTYEVIVSDPWWLALSTIALGVLLAYYLRYLVQRKQPRLINQAAFADWTHRLQASMARYPNEDALTNMWEKLQHLKLGTDKPTQDDIDKALESMETDFDSFLEGIAERRTSLRQKLPPFKEALRRWQQSSEGLPGSDSYAAQETQFLEKAPNRIQNIENLLNQNQLPAAEQQFRKEETRAHDLLRVMLKARLSTMLDEANLLDEERVGEMLTNLKRDIGQSLASLDEPEHDLFAILQEHYGHHRTLGSCKNANLGSKAITLSGGAGTWSEVYEPPTDPISAPKPVSALKLLTHNRRLAVNQSIEFELFLAPEHAGHAVKAVWNFGEGREITKSDLTASVSHVYQVPSENYSVTVDVFDTEDQLLFHDARTLAIWPSVEQTKAQRARRFFEGNEVAISLVALLIAAATGFWKLYLDEAFFGRPQDYLTAFLWGFGLDSSLQGLKPIAKNVRESLDKT